MGGLPSIWQVTMPGWHPTYDPEAANLENVVLIPYQQPLNLAKQERC